MSDGLRQPTHATLHLAHSVPVQLVRRAGRRGPVFCCVVTEAAPKGLAAARAHELASSSIVLATPPCSEPPPPSESAARKCAFSLNQCQCRGIFPPCPGSGAAPQPCMRTRTPNTEGREARQHTSSPAERPHPPPCSAGDGSWGKYQSARRTTCTRARREACGRRSAAARGRWGVLRQRTSCARGALAVARGRRLLLQVALVIVFGNPIGRAAARVAAVRRIRLCRDG